MRLGGVTVTAAGALIVRTGDVLSAALQLFCASPALLFWFVILYPMLVGSPRGARARAGTHRIDPGWPVRPRIAPVPSSGVGPVDVGMARTPSWPVEPLGWGSGHQRANRLRPPIVSANTTDTRRTR